MKTKEELNAIKDEAETLNKKLAALSEDELKEVTGGLSFGENGIILDVGDSFDYVYENRHYRYRIQNPYTVESTLMSVYVQVYAIIGNSVTNLFYADLPVGQLFIMSYSGRYEEDGKTKIG